VKRRSINVPIVGSKVLVLIVAAAIDNNAYNYEDLRKSVHTNAKSYVKLTMIVTTLSKLNQYSS